MNDSRQLALDALKQAKYAIKGREHTGFIDNAIAAIEAEIALVVEPVAWSVTVGDDFNNCVVMTPRKEDAESQYEELITGGFESIYRIHTLYTTPPEPAVNAELLEALQEIAKLSLGWDADGSIGPNPPHYSWETVARLALDYSRAAIAKATS